MISQGISPMKTEISEGSEGKFLPWMMISLFSVTLINEPVMILSMEYPDDSERAGRTSKSVPHATVPYNE